MKISPDQARFIAMATDEDYTWDISDQDRKALRWAMDQIASLEAELGALCKPSPQAAAIPAPEAASPAATNKAESEGIPFMITSKMRRQLGGLGYSPEDIQAMTPADAHSALQASDNKGARKVAGAATPRSEGQGAGGTDTRTRKGAPSTTGSRRSTSSNQTRS